MMADDDDYRLDAAAAQAEIAADFVDAEHAATQPRLYFQGRSARRDILAHSAPRLACCLMGCDGSSISIR